MSGTQTLEELKSLKFDEPYVLVEQDRNRVILILTMWKGRNYLKIAQQWRENLDDNYWKWSKAQISMNVEAACDFLNAIKPFINKIDNIEMLMVEGPGYSEHEQKENEREEK